MVDYGVSQGHFLATVDSLSTPHFSLFLKELLQRKSTKKSLQYCTKKQYNIGLSLLDAEVLSRCALTPFKEDRHDLQPR